jgi:hypothetical protein
LGASTIGGNLAVTAGGLISQSGGLSVTGTSSFTETAPGSDILLPLANNLTGAVSIGGGANVRDVNLRNVAATANVPALAGLTSLRNLTLTLENAPVVNLPAATLTAGGNLSVTSGGTITQAGPLVVPGTTALAAAGGITLGGANDFTGAVSATSGGNVALNDVSALALGPVTAAGTVLGTAGGDITLNGVVSAAGAGDAIVLAAQGGNFVNLAGPAALAAPSGRWIVYSSDPALNAFGGLASGQQALWNRTYAGNPPATLGGFGGNRYVFSLAPVLTITSLDLTKTYGQDVTVPMQSNYSVTGFANNVWGGTAVFTADTALNAFTGAPLLTSAGAINTAPVAGSPYAITFGAGTVAPTTGYTVVYNPAGLLMVNPALLTIRADDKNVHVGEPNPPFTATYTGLVNGETPAALTGALSFATPRVLGSAPGGYPIVPSGQSSTNYTITYLDGVLTVLGTLPAALAGQIDNAFLAAVQRSLIMPALDYACVHTPSEFRPPRADWCTQAASAEKKEADE